jgi:hypothetical protein
VTPSYFRSLRHDHPPRESCFPVADEPLLARQQSPIGELNVRHHMREDHMATSNEILRPMEGTVLTQT